MNKMRRNSTYRMLQRRRNVAEARYGHLSHRNIYLTVRTNARTFAITSSCIRLKHIAINAIPKNYPYINIE